MAITITPIGVGAAPDDDTGDDARTGGLAINANFSDIKTQVDPILIPGLDALTVGEVNQLENIGATVISAAEWTAVSNLSGTNTGDNAANSLYVAKDGSVALTANWNMGQTFSSTGIDDNATSVAITIDSSENVGIGETTPLGKLHIVTADTGGTVPADSDELVIENTTNTGMTILSSTTGNGRINFTDSAITGGQIYYDHGSDILAFYSNNAVSMELWPLDTRTSRPVKILEAAAAAADTAAYGQIWVKNDAPNTLQFTDDAGTDWLLNSAGESAASETVSGVIELATQTETNTGTDDLRAVTPLKLANYSGLGGGITWRYETTSQTLVAGDGAVFNGSSLTATLPATLVVGDALVINNKHATVLTVADNGHTIEYAGTSYASNISLAQGETVHLVAVTTAIMEIV